MGTRNSVRTNSRASLTAVSISQTQFWFSRGNMISSKKSDDDVRPISANFRQVMSSIDNMAIDREPSKAAESLRHWKLKPYLSQGRVVGVDTGVMVSFKGRTFKRAAILLMSRLMAS